MGITDEALTKILKITYEDNTHLEEPLYKLSKFYSMVPKKRGGGLEHDIPYRISEAQGLGREFEDTYARVVGHSLGPRFTNQRLDFDNFYGFWDMPVNQILRANAKNSMAYINIMKRVVDSTYHSFSMHRWQQMLREGAGDIAQISSAAPTENTAASTTSKGSWTFKVTEKADIRFLLGVGTHFVLAPGRTSGTVRIHRGGGNYTAKTAVFVIDKLDEIEGQITCSLLEAPGTGATNIEKPTANDWIFLPGVHRAGGIQAVRTGDGSPNIVGTTNVMSGLGNVWPETPGTWWGLDMTLNPGRLSGARFTRTKLGTLTGLGTTDTDIGLTAKRPDRSILAALGQLSLRGGRFEYSMCNMPQFVRTAIGLTGQIRLNRVESKGADGAWVGFQALNFVTGDRSCKLMSENAIGDHQYFNFNFKDICIKTLTPKLISMWRHDKKSIDRVESKDRIYGISESHALMQFFNFKNFCLVNTK